MDIISEGLGQFFQKTIPDEFRKWIRKNKMRAIIDKRMIIKDAVSPFVKINEKKYKSLQYIKNH